MGGIKNLTSRNITMMKPFLLLVVLASIALPSSAFVKGVSRTYRQPSLLKAAEKKSTSKKSSKKKETEPIAIVTENEVESTNDKKKNIPSIRKPDIIARVVGKSGYSKKDADALLTAILETIEEVSKYLLMCEPQTYVLFRSCFMED